MESLRRFKRPGDDETHRGERQAAEQERGKQAEDHDSIEGQSDPRCSQAENRSLQGGQGHSTETFAQHDGRTRDRSDQNALQKAVAPVLDDRHRRENRGEKQNQHHRSGEEIPHEPALDPGRGKAFTQPRPDEQPENQRCGQCADDAVALTQKTRHFASP